MCEEELLIETKYGKMTVKVFVKYCETVTGIVDGVLHDDYMCVDELVVFNKKK